jgi:hypothetical protein
MLLCLRAAAIGPVSALALCSALSGCYFTVGLDDDVDTERPEITQQPQSTSVTAGQRASFFVGATGGRLSFQWQRNGLAIAGATGSAFTTAPTILADDGTLFTVRVCNDLACVTSSPALLTVLRGQ